MLMWTGNEKYNAKCRGLCGKKTIISFVRFIHYATLEIFVFSRYKVDAKLITHISRFSVPMSDIFIQTILLCERYYWISSITYYHHLDFSFSNFNLFKLLQNFILKIFLCQYRNSKQLLIHFQYVLITKLYDWLK